MSIYIDFKGMLRLSHGQNWKVSDSGLAVETRSQASKRKEATKPLRDLKMPKEVDIATAEEFRREQSSDTSLEAIRRQVSSGEIKTSWNGSQSSFLVKNGLLYREFKTGFSDVGDVAYQLVVPRKFRRQMLRLVHESILAGHLGAHKTAERILQKKFWSGIRADAVRFCRSCDACQRSLQKGKVSKVPLGSTPLIDEHFHRVAVDIVGPIVPMTSRGNRYILTLKIMPRGIRKPCHLGTLTLYQWRKPCSVSSQEWVFHARCSRTAGLSLCLT